MKNRDLSARTFYEMFEKTIRDDKVRFIEKWSGEFTKYITDILKDIVNEFGLEFYKKERKQEYYKIDVIGWEDLHNQIEKVAGFNRHLWIPKIVIEHENKKSDWMDEAVKLWFINCQLKVVISYAEKDREADLVRYVSKGLAKLPDENDAEFLLLLGRSRAKGGDRLRYTAYLWNPACKRLELARYD